MELAIKSGSISTKSIWTGRIISTIVVLFMLFDSITKLMMLDAVVRGSAEIGYPSDVIWIIGLILLVCTITYIIPRTSILGAVLLTGYLGGAVASNLRIKAPLFSHILAPVYIGVLVWAGLYFRNKQLRGLLPLKKRKNM
jgi:hypothetical protein